MSLTLTPLASDNFDYTQNPLPSPPWTNGGYNLQALGGYCEAAYTGNGFGAYTGISSPDDQYASITIRSIDLANAPEVGLFVRSNGVTLTTGYKLLYVDSGFFWLYKLESGSFQILQLPSVSLQAGDVLTLAVVGTTLYVLYNGTVIGSVVDTTYASGTTMMMLGPDNLTDVTVSNFTTGSAAVVTPPPSGGVFLGSVVVVDDAPSGASNPFLGTVTVIDSAPSGVPNPYLGKVVSGSAPSGVPNPTLGNVVVIGSKPANAQDVFLGTVEES